MSRNDRDPEFFVNCRGKDSEKLGNLSAFADLAGLKVNLYTGQIDGKSGETHYLRGAKLGILKCLYANKGDLVLKDDLLIAGWGKDKFKDDSSLTHAIGELRAIFGTDVIETVPGSGYRLLLPPPAGKDQQPGPPTTTDPPPGQPGDLLDIASSREVSPRFGATSAPAKSGGLHTWAVVLAICLVLAVLVFVIGQVLSKRNHTAQAGNSKGAPAVQPNQRDIDCDDLMPVGTGKYWHAKPKEGIRFVLRDIQNVRFQESVIMEYFGKNEVRRSSLGLSKYNQMLTVESDGITVHTDELYVQGYYRASMHMLDTQTGVVFPCPFFAYVGYRSCPKCVDPPIERIR